MTTNFDPPSGTAEGLTVSGPQGPGRGCGIPGVGAQDAAMFDAFALADGLFREAAEDFARLRAQIREGGGLEGRGRGARKADPAAVGDGLKEAVRLARDLRAATQLMLEERNRVDKLRKEIAGGGGAGGALDLDAARSEIGRRLACLRRAAGS